MKAKTPVGSLRLPLTINQNSQNDDGSTNETHTMPIEV